MSVKTPFPTVHAVNWLLGFILWAAACLPLPTHGAAGGQLHPDGPSLVASTEPDWPQWRGPRRDGISDETGLLQSWPESPQLIWSAQGIGQGYSAPIIVKDRIYITGDLDDDLLIFALDLQGRILWRAKNGRAWRTPYPGARASCTFSEGRLYHLNSHGRVASFDSATGRELWTINLFDQFGGKNITWATSENLLVDGPRLIVTPGGSKALMAALDKRTGQTLWMTEPLRLGPSSDPAQRRLPEPPGSTDSCGYASPILLQHQGRRWIINCSLRHVFGVDADTGKLLFTEPFPTRYSVIAATPVLAGDALLVTAPDAQSGGKLLRVVEQNAQRRIETVWTTKLDTCHGGIVYANQRLYGSWYRGADGLAAVDAGTGAVLYQKNDLDQGSVLWADGRLYYLTQEGEMFLLNPGPANFEVVGRFSLTSERKSDAWTHPVVVHKRLYLRYHDTLRCFDVSRSPE